MTKKLSLLIAAAAVLGGFSLYLNRDCTARDQIPIECRSRPVRGFARRGSPETAAVDPLIFWFNRKVKLTALKVIPTFDIETNKYPQPVWSLVSDSNSVPVKNFIYGMRIQGMHPVIKGAAPDPLVPGVAYRLFVEAGPEKAQRDFTPVARTE
jgi:hypothetical protein